MKQEQNLKRAQIFRFTPGGGEIWPPFETARGQSEHLTFQCDQWEPIQNSQLIGKYKEKSVKQEQNLKQAQIFRFTPRGVNLTPHLKLPEDRVNTSLFNVTNESPFETVN